MTHITLAYPISANDYWRYVNGKVLRSRAANLYKAYVGGECLAQGVRSLAGELEVTVHVYRPRKVGDLDNTLKVLLDSLQGFAYTNDSQVVAIHAYRHDDKDNPRAEVTIREAGRE